MARNTVGADCLLEQVGCGLAGDKCASQATCFLDLDKARLPGSSATMCDALLSGPMLHDGIFA